LPTKHEIPTPALLVDLDAFEANLALMSEHLRRAGKKLRPHFKAHKCVEIAQRQIAAGGCGVCVATLSEAEVTANAGITGLLLTSPLADRCKMARIVATGAAVVVDHTQQVDWYQQAAQSANRTVEVLIDLDVGDHRTGARSIEQALEIAQAIDRAPNLLLKGLQAYSVHGSHAPDRAQISKTVFQHAAETRGALARAGLSTEIVSGGSTGTWDIDAAIAEVTEIQAGSYVLMDMAYGKLGLPFHNAMTVIATVVSANHNDFVTVDGGLKSFSTDRGYGPDAMYLPGSAYRWGGDEFGYLDIVECRSKPRLGGRIEFIPPHCDPTVNLYNKIYACRGDNVDAVWEVHSGK
jgi:D-serine deaminase-like pyridoxal phosphate-dependent protein